MRRPMSHTAKVRWSYIVLLLSAVKKKIDVPQRIFRDVLSLYRLTVYNIPKMYVPAYTSFKVDKNSH